MVFFTGEAPIETQLVSPLISSIMEGAQSVGKMAVPP